MSTPAIHATGLRKAFRSSDGTRVVAVDDVDLTVHPGEIVAFLGPNGAGKTTTVDLLLGLTTPDAGTLEVYGTSPAHAVRQGRVSAVMQTGGLLNDFTVEETVRAIAALHGRSDRVAVVLGRARLDGIAARRVEACSGGEQQRLKFALALLPDPDLVILDEPTTGMDVGARQEFWHAMRADAALGRTIVFATHYLAEADEFAERTVLMNHGRIVHDAATADVRAAYGGRTLTFRPPPEVVGGAGIDTDWLARVREALAPLGVSDVEESAASLEAAFLALTAEPSRGTDAPELEGATR
ncbi:ABC transporter ATP-binding protein [Nocardioides sp. zg-1228]|uniref:ABC transporter ATP-binding protein n=1 Tax=Nocardioides sp. zg-1228 TaxID=2763008 RepID=UPI0016432B79|nr:ABC transporter ATP-binding protein [Nocardioides sp. zg-1228]MBC2931858.1 ABC transporter ATP-binding protein [Nocardioides sp. zg-1228]QSF57424.1 ABC transporter ATP-binding protein [Nocardioides sp. zg-1228]